MLMAKEVVPLITYCERKRKKYSVDDTRGSAYLDVLKTREYERRKRRETDQQEVKELRAELQQKTESLRLKDEVLQTKEAECNRLRGDLAKETELRQKAEGASERFCEELLRASKELNDLRGLQTELDRRKEVSEKLQEDIGDLQRQLDLQEVRRIGELAAQDAQVSQYEQWRMEEVERHCAAEVDLCQVDKLIEDAQKATEEANGQLTGAVCRISDLQEEVTRLKESSVSYLRRRVDRCLREFVEEEVQQAKWLKLDLLE